MTEEPDEKSVEETARQIAREFKPPATRPLSATHHCRHYSYDREKMQPRCAWGIDLVTEPKSTNQCMPPGLQGLTKCDYREEFTDVERVAWEEWRNKSALRALAILALIPGTSRKRDIHWGGTGRFQCPACVEGVVRWLRVKQNGHLHAACTTPGCFEIIE